MFVLICFARGFLRVRVRVRVVLRVGLGLMLSVSRRVSEEAG